MDTAEDPTDALAVLSDETRIDILRALADADGPLSFSRLRDRVGVADSGRFNYHLRRLCEYFVRETEAGYELGHAGARLIDAAGVADSGTPVDGSGDPGAVDYDSCPVCGEADCERLFHVHLTPPWG